MSRGIILPEVEVLPEAALIPDGNMITPPPNQFTHELIWAADFFFDADEMNRHPGGTLEAGARVVLLACHRDTCWVADARGLYVRINCGSLRKLAASAGD